MAIEILKCDKRIYQLTTAPGLAAAMNGSVKIHADVAPENESNDRWIVFEHFSGRNAVGVGGVKVFAKPGYLIKVCGRDCGYQALEDAVTIVEQFLKEPATIEGVRVGKFVYRQTLMDIDILKNGIRNYWIGLQFDVVAYKT